MPQVGDTRKVPCSWGCGAEVVEVWQPYPADSGVVGFFWDCSACPCFDVLFAERLPRVMHELGRRGFPPTPETAAACAARGRDWARRSRAEAA